VNNEIALYRHSLTLSPAISEHYLKTTISTYT